MKTFKRFFVTICLASTFILIGCNRETGRKEQEKVSQEVKQQNTPSQETAELKAFSKKTKDLEHQINDLEKQVKELKKLAQTTQKKKIITKGTEELEKLSQGFVEVGKKAIPAVIFIRATANVQAQSKSSKEHDDPMEYFNDRFRRFFEDPGPRVSGGSGFLATKDGYIVTNYHVVKDADEITVILNNGDEYPAKLIGKDPRTDVAVIKIEGKDLPYLTFGDSDNLDIGQSVVAIGYPFALQATLTTGVVSGKGRQNLHINDLEDFIQTDAAINFGNSGGPLTNLNGEVIGINSAILSRGTGIGFAIPSNWVKYIMTQIIDSGSVKRGYIGIAMQEIDKEMAEAISLEKTEGVLISEVLKDSAAEKAGLKEGDIILEYNDKPIKTIANFRNEISLLEPGKKINLVILRKGEKQQISLELGQHPVEYLSSNQTTQLGMEVVEVKDISPDIMGKWGYQDIKEGLIITSIKRNSLAAKAGLRPGMLLIQVNQQRIKTAKDFHDSMESAKNNKHILLLVRFQNVTRFITVKTN